MTEGRVTIAGPPVGGRRWFRRPGVIAAGGLGDLQKYEYRPNAGGGNGMLIPANRMIILGMAAICVFQKLEMGCRGRPPCLPLGEKGRHGGLPLPFKKLKLWPAEVYMVLVVGCVPSGDRIMNFQLIGKIKSVELIASGNGIRDLARLEKLYGAGQWRKLKGIGVIRLGNGRIRKAELHWYEAHGIGKKEMKRKKYLD